MLPDAKAVFSGQVSYADAIKDIDHQELLALAAEIYNTIGSIVQDANDAAVDFVPRDEHLKDPSEEGWTLGHVIVHLTAGLEENAANGATMARGVNLTERLRYETPWETVHTAAQIQQRLTESRRITAALLNAWPDQPHLEVTRTPIPPLGPLNAIGVTILGLMHANAHLDQLREIMRQAS